MDISQNQTGLHAKMVGQSQLSTRRDQSGAEKAEDYCRPIAKLFAGRDF